VAAADLLEAEGRNLKRNALRTSLAIGLALVAVLFLFIGTGLLLAALYMKFAALWGQATGLLATGTASFLCGGLFLWLTMRINR
jgi:hypothetical protein